MNICLAGQDPISQSQKEIIRKKLKPFILESFIQVNDKSAKLLKYYPFYMLDSGAFTFINSGKSVIKQDLIKYVDKYIAYINKYDIKLFFEMDIDKIIGYKNVRDIRAYINSETGKKCIPVWHAPRGYKEYCKMCESHDYVAIGGMVSSEFSKDKMYLIPRLIKEAHRYKTKIHGLGFTKFTKLPTHHFDSVDSTAWLTGVRFGHLYKFTGTKLEKIKRPPGTKCRYKEVAARNFIEWVKFQKWAVRSL